MLNTKINTMKKLFKYLVLLSIFYSTSTILIGQSAMQREQVISEFSFRLENNPFLKNDILGDIGNGKIVCVSNEVTRTGHLIATFNAPGYDVKIGEIKQESGVTENDFSKPVKYDLYKEEMLVSSYVVDFVIFTGLPILRIYTDNQNEILYKDTYVGGFYHLFAGKGMDQMNGSGPLKIRGRGNTTWRFAKKPYKVVLDEPASFLGMPDAKEWVLLANYIDDSMIKTYVAQFLSILSGHPYTVKSKPVELFINDKHVGLYQLTEQTEILEGRIPAVGGFFIEVDGFERSADRGALFFETPKLTEYSRHDGHMGSVFVILQSKDRGHSDSTQIKEFITMVESSLYSPDFLDDNNGYKKYVDIESFVSWYIVNELAHNNDASFFSSVYMYKAPEGKLTLGPAWDFDLAFGGYPGSIPEGWKVKEGAWIDRMFEDPFFIETLKKRWSSIFANKDKIFSYIDYLKDELRPSSIKNSAIWGESYLQKDEFMSIYSATGDFNKGVGDLKTFLNKRMEWLDKKINEL